MVTWHGLQLRLGMPRRSAACRQVRGGAPQPAAAAARGGGGDVRARAADRARGRERSSEAQ